MNRTLPPPRKSRRPDRAAIVAHEIRGPLGVVTALAEILAARDLGVEERHLLDLIRLAGTHCRMVAEDLLAEEGIDRHQFAVSDAPVDLPQLIRRQCDLFRPLGAAERLSVEIAEDAPREIISDGKRLAQILFNLLANALKASDSAHVTIRLGPGRSGKGYVLEVSDDGPGLPPGFEIRPYGTTGPDGSGLGLWISSEIARALGGRLVLTPGENGGTSARLEVPAGRTSRRRPPAAVGTDAIGSDSAASGPLTGRNVLIVDDSAVSRQLLVAILESFGLSSMVATGSREAVEIALERRPDLVVTDWILNGESGADVLTRLQMKLGEHMPPALLVTAVHRLPAAMARFPVVHKPFSPQEFYAAVAAILKKDSDSGKTDEVCREI